MSTSYKLIVFWSDHVCEYDVKNKVVALKIKTQHNHRSLACLPSGCVTEKSSLRDVFNLSLAALLYEMLLFCSLDPLLLSPQALVTALSLVLFISPRAAFSSGALHCGLSSVLLLVLCWAWLSGFLFVEWAKLPDSLWNEHFFCNVSWC